MLTLILAVLLAQAQTAPIATIAQGSSSEIDEPQEILARSSAEWAALWKRHGGPGQTPTVDLSANLVAAVFLGTRPTAGFAVDIVGARREAEVLVVDYVERTPGADDIVAQVLTAPFHLVTLPRHNGPVRFQKVADTGRR